jgi:hypothetical protein
MGQPTGVRAEQQPSPGGDIEAAATNMGSMWHANTLLAIQHRFHRSNRVKRAACQIWWFVGSRCAHPSGVRPRAVDGRQHQTRVLARGKRLGTAETLKRPREPIMADTRSAHSSLDTRTRQIGGGDDLLAPSGPAIHVAPTTWGLVMYAAVVHGRELNNLLPSRRTRARADAG